MVATFTPSRYTWAHRGQQPSMLPTPPGCLLSCEAECGIPALHVGVLCALAIGTCLVPTSVAYGQRFVTVPALVTTLTPSLLAVLS